MTQQPPPTGGGQPHNDPQQFGQQNHPQNQWIAGSAPSASQPEETQQLPPYGQTSAGHPQAGSYSQPSAGNPYAQPPTQQPTQPQSQPYGQPPTQSWGQPPSGPAGGSSFGAWQSQAPQQQPQQQKRFSDANPFRAAFDFGFKSYATPGIAKIVYIVAIVLGVVSWIGGSIYWFRVASAINHLASSLSGPFGGGTNSNAGSAFTVIGIVSLVLGWIPVLLEILVVRVFLEAAIAMTRTADDARHIREKIED